MNIYSALSLRLVAHRGIQRSRNVFLVVVTVVVAVVVVVVVNCVSYRRDSKAWRLRQLSQKYNLPKTD